MSRSRSTPNRPPTTRSSGSSRRRRLGTIRTAPTRRTLAGWAIDAAFAGLFGIVLLTVLVGRILPLTGRPVLVVAGGSMAPELSVGSAIVLEPTDRTALVAGDVVSLRSGLDQAVFTHRIVRVVERDGAPWLETQGDANPAVDPSLNPASAVIGRLAMAVPLLGYAIAVMSRPSGVLFVIALVATLIVARLLLESRLGASSPLPERRRRTSEPA